VGEGAEVGEGIAGFKNVQDENLGEEVPKIEEELGKEISENDEEDGDENEEEDDDENEAQEESFIL